jgi:RNA polymerase sigma factor (sigma-70 family)
MVDPVGAQRTDDRAPAPDTELLRRYAAEKSDPAFAALVERHLDLVYSAALRRVGGDAHAAADVAQQVFVDLARHAATLSRGVVLPAWLYATTRNIAVDFVRTEQRRRVREKEAYMRQELNGHDRPVDEWERLRPLLDGAMDELGARDREAVLLRFFARRPFAEIGRALATSEDAARMRVDRALEKLRALLARRGVTSTAVALGALIANEAAAAAPAGLAANVSCAALAAGEGGSATVTLLQFMSITKFIATAVGMMVLLSVGVAVREWADNRVAQTALATSTAEMNRLAAQSRVLAGQVADSEKALAALEQASQPSTVAPAAPAAGVTPTDPTQNGRNFLSLHPEAGRLVVESQRLNIRQGHQLFFREVGLSAAQMDQFVYIMAEASAGMAWNTAGQVPFAKVDVGPPVDVAEREARIRAVIGDTNYERLLQFRREQGARNLAEEIVGDANASAPISTDQALRLMQMFAQQSPNYRAGKSFSLRDFDWERATVAARSILGDKQAAVVAAVRERYEAADALSQAEREVRDAAKRAIGLPPNF